MKNKLSLPFKNLTPEAWQNLALAATFAFYVAFMGFFLLNTEICKTYRVDYCAFWSGGRVINERGLADVYNLDVLSQYQREIYAPEDDINIDFKPVELPYLPLFIIPFKFFSFLDIVPSYLLWTLINLIGFIFYLRFFAKKMCGFKAPFRINLMMMLSLPVFVNFYEGQLNIWLAICAGEFMRAYLSEKPYKAGLWLGGWLLKPQLLILIIPYLLLKRSVKTITGFAFSSIAIFGVSFAMIKTEGFLNLINTITESAEGGATSNAAAMINWRMLGWHLSALTSESIGAMIVIIGTILTACITLAKFRNVETEDPTMVVIALIGIIAATIAVTWHSHLHMAVIFVPPMIYLLMNEKFKKIFLLAWLFIPVMIHFLTFSLLAMINIGAFPENIGALEKLLPGLTGFILNLLILSWAINEEAGKKMRLGITDYLSTKK